MNSGFKNILNYRGVSAAMAAGQRTAIALVNGVQTHRLWVTITGTLTISASAGPVILNRGSLASVFQFFLNENGTDVWQQDGRIAAFITQMLSPSAVSPNLRLTATAVAAYALKERICLYAVSPLSVVPRETAFMESDPRQRFELQAQFRTSTPIASLASGITATLTNVQFAVEQDYVANETNLPYLRPRIREQVDTIAGANTAYPIYIKSNSRIRGIIIQQDSDAGEVVDIINKIAVRGDNGDLIGPQPVPMDDLAAMQQLDFGGAVYNGAAGAPTAPSPANGAYLGFYYQRAGRLSNVLYPWRDYTNFRFEVDCQPSITTGGTNSVIRTQILELERPAAVAGRNLVTPTLPSFLED